MDESLRRTHDWRRFYAGMLAACSVFVLLSLLASFAITRGQVAGPPINIQVGPYHVLSRTTTTPTCHPLTMGCVASQRAGTTAGYYTIWVLTVSEAPIPGGLQEQLQSARVLTLQIRP
ncbi:MAG: hypothetical protein ABI901_05610 [Roseiflexaceae bacterium]